VKLFTDLTCRISHYARQVMEDSGPKFFTQDEVSVEMEAVLFESESAGMVRLGVAPLSALIQIPSP
jgi:hypothetical protein